MYILYGEYVEVYVFSPFENRPYEYKIAPLVKTVLLSTVTTYFGTYLYIILIKRTYILVGKIIHQLLGIRV